MPNKIVPTSHILAHALFSISGQVVLCILGYKGSYNVLIRVIPSNTVCNYIHFPVDIVKIVIS